MINEIYEVPALNTSGLSRLIAQAPGQEITERLKSFYDLFPYGENLPGSLAIMDINSRILACNEYAWKQVRLNSAAELIDCTSDRVEKSLNWDKSIIGQARKNDILVLQSGQAIFEEKIEDVDMERVLVCKKQAIYDHNKVPVGILSLALPLMTKKKAICSDAIIPLTPRQIACLREVALGCTYKQVGRKLGLTEKTVEHYMRAVKARLNIYTRAELISEAIARGLVGRM